MAKVKSCKVYLVIGYITKIFHARERRAGRGGGGVAVPRVHWLKCVVFLVLSGMSVVRAGWVLFTPLYNR